MPAVTSAQWVISFTVESVTNQDRYTITLANTVPRSVVDGIVRALRELGYLTIHVRFAVVLP